MDGVRIDLEDTIVAAASAPGAAWNSIVRASGPDCLRLAVKCFPEIAIHKSAARTYATKLILSESGAELPGELHLWPSNRSYTREPTFEFHTLGSPPLLNAAVRTICRAGARIARPGEFTLRAFLAGRLDLTQAEAVLGLIEAGSQRELTAAIEQFAGGISGPVHALRDDLLNLTADLEAGLDFTEEDISFVSRRETLVRLEAAAEQSHKLVEKMHARDAVSLEPTIVLLGPPNSGKSSLFNALTGGQALVSPIAGTTRDYVSAPLQCEEFACRLIDTAGIEEALPHSLDAFAQSQRSRVSESAQLSLLCGVSQSKHDAPGDRRTISVLTKCDHLTESEASHVACVRTSAVTLRGLNELRREIAVRLRELHTAQSDVVLGTSQRCRESVGSIAAALEAAKDSAAAGMGDEMIAGDLRIALEGLGEILGTITTEDVLDRVFSRFCIGK